MERIQIVVDTNIIVAAFRSRRGAANLLLDKLRDERWQVNVSNPLLFEYEDVLKRPEMSQFISHEDADKFLDAVCSISKFHPVFFLWRFLTRDPDDAFILELAIKAKADFIITFNTKDFSHASDFGVKLASPREFLEFMGDLQ
jgi:putative PIN family toxin of toxin-antitoxin system